MVSLLLSVLAWSDFTCLHHLLEFFDLALDLVPPKFVIRRVPSISEKCRLSFEDFSFLETQGRSVVCFLTTFRGRKESIAEVSSIIDSLNLTSQDSVLRTEYQSFSVIHPPSARRALSCISRDSIFLMTGLCSDDIIGLAKMV